MRLLKFVVPMIFAMAVTSAYAYQEPQGPGEGGGGVETCIPSLLVDKSGPREVKVGDFMTYTIRLTNNGSCNLFGIDLSDFLPDRVQFRDADPRESDVIPSFPPGFDARVDWNNFNLLAGQSRTFELEIHVVGEPNRTLVNRACATHMWTGQVCDTVRTRVVTGPPIG